MAKSMHKQVKEGVKSVRSVNEKRDRIVFKPAEFQSNNDRKLLTVAKKVQVDKIFQKPEQTRAERIHHSNNTFYGKFIKKHDVAGCNTNF